MSVSAFQDNLFTSPLSSYHAVVTRTFNTLPDGWLSELATRVAAVVVAPLAYIALGLLAGVGYVMQAVYSYFYPMDHATFLTNHKITVITAGSLGTFSKTPAESLVYCIGNILKKKLEHLTVPIKIYKRTVGPIRKEMMDRLTTNAKNIEWEITSENLLEIRTLRLKRQALDNFILTSCKRAFPEQEESEQIKIRDAVVEAIFDGMRQEELIFSWSPLSDSEIQVCV